jgi:ABC-2 type transport system ATP-binding protein
MNPEPTLSIDNLRVDYGELTAVDDLSLAVEPGEILVLVGPNGAGKTSTIRVLASLLEPTYGEVRILGIDLFEEPARALSQLGYMPDLAPVVPNLKVWEFLDLYAHSYGYGAGERRERVDHCLEQVKLSDRRNLMGRALSRGMMQRVVLAKTLLHDPKLLLLDEPASGMDPIARRDLRLTLQRLAAGGASVIVSSHILGELADMCTSIAIMLKGRLLRSGSVRTVLDSMQSESAQVSIELLESTDPALAWLEAHAEVDDIRVESLRIDFRFLGDKHMQSALLRELIERDFGLVAFSPRQSGIESLLLELITDVET